VKSLSLPLADGSTVTVSAAALRLGISHQAVYQRLASGWTPFEAANTPRGQRPARLVRPPKPPREKLPTLGPGAYTLVVCAGETLTLAQWARRLGISQQLARYRLKRKGAIFYARRGRPAQVAA
jgi:ferric-dicitrate binding protein FerR (iron transport regulator)